MKKQICARCANAHHRNMQKGAENFQIDDQTFKDQGLQLKECVESGVGECVCLHKNV